METLIEEIRNWGRLVMQFEEKIARCGLTEEETESYQTARMKSEVAKMKYQQALGR